MRTCAMEPRSAPPSPEEEADALYQARHRAHYQYSSYREHRPCRRHRPSRLDPDLTTLTTADVHDYPSSESGIAADCPRAHSSHRRRRPRSDDDDDAPSPDDADDLDEILPARLAAVRLARDPPALAPPAALPARWNRDNIAATMERFEPADYCYAYYEAGAAARHHLSMPSSSRKASRQRGRGERDGAVSATRDRPPRHAFVTRYGTEENIYEEIADGARSCPKHHRAALRQSLVSLDQSVVEEEVRRVESRHKRILGELNLSVEAMLMPECESPESERAEGCDNIEELLRVGPTDELLSPASCNPPDLDSGFSGSSSGASYVGSLRYKQAGGGGSTSLHLPAVAYGTRGGVRILSAPAQAECGGTAARCARRPAAEGPSARSSSCGDAKSTGFWNKKAWRRIPGFSSSNSINKAGLTVRATQTESWWCRWIP